jgi:hypothetical protein
MPAPEEAQAQLDEKELDALDASTLWDKNLV